MNVLLEDNRVAKATHNIMAYRIRQRSQAGRSPSSTIHKPYGDDKNEEARWLCDNDEDGEGGAGTKVAQLLDMMDVEDVVVVVSRWYGGVKLGPQRFKVINNVAREAVLALSDCSSTQEVS
jgi:putative IMPACT (imprinted ancient) family translation regulator